MRKWGRPWPPASRPVVPRSHLPGRSLPPQAQGAPPAQATPQKPLPAGSIVCPAAEPPPPPSARLQPSNSPSLGKGSGWPHRACRGAKRCPSWAARAGRHSVLPPPLPPKAVPSRHGLPKEQWFHACPDRPQPQHRCKSETQQEPERPPPFKQVLPGRMQSGGGREGGLWEPFGAAQGLGEILGGLLCGRGHCRARESKAPAETSRSGSSASSHTTGEPPKSPSHQHPFT